MENLENLNSDLRAGLLRLKADPAFKFLVEQWNHWKNQCLNEVLKPGDNEAAKGEYSAYGRVLNSPDFFIQQLSPNPGLPTINLDPHVNPHQAKPQGAAAQKAPRP